MKKLIYIREAKGAKGYLVLGIAEDGEKKSYTVSKSVYEELGSPARSSDIDSEQAEIIAGEDGRVRALKKALSLLSYSDDSERELGIKLRRAGFSRESAEQAVLKVKSLGYVNEEKQIERAVLNEANLKLSGPMKIIPKLVAKGYSSQLVRTVLTRLSDEGEIDFENNKRRIREEYFSDSDSSDEYKKFLYKRGYKA